MITNGKQLNNLWGTTKELFKTIEPYQPYASTVSIFSKAIYKIRNRSEIEFKIAVSKSHIRSIDFAKDKEALSFLVKSIEYQMDRAKADRRQIRIALLQLISLAFNNPGSNIWNSIMTLLSRFFSIQHHFSYTREDPTNKMRGILGLFSSLGTCATLLKQTGAIREYPPVCRAMIGISFISMAIESCQTARKWLQPPDLKTTHLQADSNPQISNQKSGLTLNPSIHII